MRASEYKPLFFYNDSSKSAEVKSVLLYVFAKFDCQMVRSTAIKDK